MDTILVSQLKLSTRAMHLLQKMNIQTVEEFMNIPVSEFERKRGVGKKTIDELAELKNNIAQGLIDFDDIENTSLAENNRINDVPELPKEILEKIAQYPITSLGLSNRSQNGLQRAGIKTIDQVLYLSDEDLKNISSLGQKSFDEIKRFRIEWLIKNHFILMDFDESIDIPEDKRIFFEGLAGILHKIIFLDVNTLYKLCDECGFSNQIENIELSDITKYDYIYLLEHNDEIKDGVKHYFYDFFSAEKEFVAEEELITKIERDFEDETFKSALFDILKYRGGLGIIGDYYVLKRDSLKEYISRMENSVKVRILFDRFNGLSLQEIGVKNNLTRERVRQITVKMIGNFPRLKEDYYASIFQYFKFNRELFYNVFPKADKRTFEYLSMRYRKGKYALDRENLDRYHGLYSFVIEDYIEKDEATRWKKGLTRQKIAWRVLIIHSGEYFDKESFRKAYDIFLKQNSLDSQRYSFNPYSITNIFRCSKHVVFNRDGEFRYFENDATELWYKLDMRRYRDSVISSELIFRDYSELMEEYDIRNGYELFCLLKNTFNNDIENDDSICRVHFRRIPVMIIGNGDEEKQIVKFLKEISPIEYWTFYAAYEERYGLRKESAIANLGSYIEKYHVGGEYITDLPYLSKEDEKKVLRRIEEKPIWSIEKLERIFEEECVSSDKDVLNNTTLYNLGYTLNVGYAYSRKYTNVTECIEEYIFSKDLVDLNEIDQDIVRLSVFKSYIYSLRMSLNYIEVSQKLYASRYFLEQEYGLTDERINSIQKKASYLYREKYFNGNSLWNDLKDDADVKMLHDNKWLFTSILRQQDGVYSLSIVNAVVLSLQKDELSLVKICSWIVEQEGKMTLEHLTERVNEIFGSGLDKNKLAFKIKEQGNATEILTDGVDEYLEQIISATETEDDLFKEEFF